MSTRIRLCDLAGDAGFTVESLAQVLGVDRSTVYRLWVNRNWIEDASSKTLLRLMGVVPGVDREVGRSVLGERRRKLVRAFDDFGQPLNEVLIDAALAADVKPHYLYTALEAALHLLREDTDSAVKCLRACWGREQTRALDVVFGTHSSRSIVADPEPLLTAASTAFDELLRSRGYSFSRIIAQAHIAHHVGKATGKMLRETALDAPNYRIKNEKAGFFIRGAYMGVLRQKDDLDVAARYQCLVEQDTVARLVELWAFPSWTGDISASDDFSLPHSVSLRKTADEVIREIQDYNDAYVWYLATTYIPLALEEVDSQFGGRLDRLGATLAERAERSELEAVAAACQTLAKRVASVTDAPFGVA